MALRCSIGAVIAACGLIIPLTAQPSQQAFEVASVKRAAKPGRLTFPVIGNGLFNVPSTTAGELIALAYELDRQQIVGGPRWLWSETFEIKARATDNMASLAQMRPMVRSLLQPSSHRGRSSITRAAPSKR